MRLLLFTGLLALAAGFSPIAPAASALAGPLARAPNALTLRLQALEGAAGSASPDAVLEVGAVSGRPRGDGRGAIQVRKRVALRLDGPQASARVSVALAVDMPGCTVRVDGHTITAVLRVIDPVHRVGATVVHEIELTIPANVAAGPFLGNLNWFAETD